MLQLGVETDELAGLVAFGHEEVVAGAVVLAHHLLRLPDEHQVLQQRDAQQDVAQQLHDARRGEQLPLVELLLLLHLELQELALLDEPVQLAHGRLAVDRVEELLLGERRQLPAEGVDRELHLPDLVEHEHVDVADVDLEEVVAALDVVVRHVVLHLELEQFVLVRDVHHQDRDVEALLQLLVVHPFGLHLDVAFVEFGHFLEEVRLALVFERVGHFHRLGRIVSDRSGRYFVQNARVQGLVDAVPVVSDHLCFLCGYDVLEHKVAKTFNEAVSEDFELDALRNLIVDVEFRVVLVALEERVDKDDGLVLQDRDLHLVVVGLEAAVAHLLVLAHGVEHVARGVQALVLDHLDLVVLARPLDELDEGVHDLDAEVDDVLRDEVQLPLEHHAQQRDEVARLARDHPLHLLFPDELLQLGVVVFAQVLKELEYPEHEFLLVRAVVVQLGLLEALEVRLTRVDLLDAGHLHVQQGRVANQLVFDDRC